MELVKHVRAYVDRHRLLTPGQSVVLGVSGGADSLCLLDCLHRLGYRCVVAHLDHRLRPGSSGEAERVGQLAVSLDLPYVSAEADLSSRSGSLEEAARLARYRFLATVAHSHNTPVIAVGHTADDQAETVLMHLLRGAGPEGLRGMLPETRLGDWVDMQDGGELRLIRPLLTIARSQTEAHCAAIGWQPIVDASNDDPRYLRNRLRHELLPALERYNPRIRSVLARTARVMAGQAALTDELLDKSWGNWAREAGPGVLALRRRALQSAPLALQRAALRRAVATLRPQLRDIGFDAIERLVRSLGSGNGRRHAVVGGLEVVPLEAELIIRHPDAPISFPELPQLPSRSAWTLPVPGSLTLAAGWRLTADLGSAAAGRPISRRQVLFDQAHLPGRLTVRPPKPGDRIRPVGMHGSMKLSDLFVNRKVPWPARERWPLVCHGSEVLWAVELHVSRAVAPPADPDRSVRLQVLPPEQER